MATPEEQRTAMLANLEDKTGRPLAQWMTLLTEAGLEKHGAMMSLLKGEHGVTHGFANLIVHEFRNRDAEPVDLVAQQYGGKESLRPILDRVLAVVEDFGSDIEVAPKKTYVSLRRRKQFAQVQPSTRTRVDVGLNLKGHAPTERMKATSGMCTHKVGVTSPTDVDEELVGWLRTAYDAAG